MGVEHPHAHEGAYVLSCDLPLMVGAFKHVGLETPPRSDSFFAEVRDGLASRIQAALPGAGVKVVNMDDVGANILKEIARRDGELKDAVIVSTCPHVASSKHGFTLELNRLVDIDGQILGIGPRPGFSPIEDQIQPIANAARDRQIVLVEDGTFSGRTVCYILDEFRKVNVKVGALALGLAFPDALARIRKIYGGEIITVEETGLPLDWMPDHDFFPFVPNCGRVYGSRIGDYCVPHYSSFGASYGIPYLLGFCPMEEWTSIPHGGCVALTFFCLEKTYELFRRLEQMNGRPIVFGDLLSTTPRVSIPIEVGKPSFPRMHKDMRVVDYLSDALHEF